MRKSKFTEEQIAYAPRQVESGPPPGDVRQLLTCSPVIHVRRFVSSCTDLEVVTSPANDTHGMQGGSELVIAQENCPRTYKGVIMTVAKRTAVALVLLAAAKSVEAESHPCVPNETDICALEHGSFVYGECEQNPFEPILDCYVACVFAGHPEWTWDSYCWIPS